ncbi:threonine synthase [Arthrobacter sp. MSA 4-2]|uniref:threonine synthase n=1 Tax=Arthrobacter sp. MSA 4-2 TaxID=2794349 RepID=UPI0018E7094F|nr:threonine synthase [Arthrobacter sp. MSA 4-2]MBJ2122004.1 threonine synthase [Arthrobacter sp. MSA 4-2]
MAHQWRGVIREYADRLPVTESTEVVTLGEGGTPLVRARALSELTGSEVYLKVEGMNPTGSFKDRGMTMAMTAAVAAGAKAVVCASTGNTSASAAAYATQAGITCAVLVPDGKISMGKLSQAIAHGAQLLQVNGNFDNCLDVARKLAEAYPVFLVNSVNPARLEGQKTAAFEVVDSLGDAPDYHLLPVGNAGNISAYWKGYKEYAAPYATADGELAPVATKTPVMWGFQAEGASPLVKGHPVTEPDTIATAIRIGNPASWDLAVAARDESGGLIEAVSDDEILEAHRWLSAREGVFVEPASAAGVAGLLKKHGQGLAPKGKTIVITVTGHGLKDPQWALRTADGSDVEPTKVEFDVVSVAAALGLEETADRARA